MSDAGGYSREVGTDRLVGVLGGFPVPEDVGRLRQVRGAILLADVVPDGGHRLVGDADRVGAHVGDEADEPRPGDLHPFVEGLGDHHRPVRLHPQRLRRLLLELGGRERRGGLPAAQLLSNLADDEGAVLHRGAQDRGLRRVARANLLPADLHQLRRERGRRPPLQPRRQRPILLGHEGGDLLFPPADHLDRHRLHPSRRQAPTDLRPQQRGEGVPDDPVEDAARLLRVELVLVEGTGMRHPVGDPLFRDLVEKHALDRRGGRFRIRGSGLRLLSAGRGLRLLRRPFPFLPRVGPDGVGDVPGDRLALPVGVGREEHGRRRPRGIQNVPEDLLPLLDDDVRGGEAVLDVDPEAAFREVHHVSHGGKDLEPLPEDLLYRLRLRGRLDDDQRTCHCAS